MRLKSLSRRLKGCSMRLKAYKNFPLQALALPPQALMLPLVRPNVYKNGHGHSCDHVTAETHYIQELSAYPTPDTDYQTVTAKLSANYPQLSYT